jgi:uncharacterized damage-inducible protein DinB
MHTDRKHTILIRVYPCPFVALLFSRLYHFLMDTLDRLFLDCSVRRLHQLCGRIGSCLSQLNDDQIWARGGENENAVGNLVLHLSGNVRQWIVSGAGGAPDTRNRDSEFAARGGMPKAELETRLLQTVDAAAAVIEGLTPERLAQRVIIQGYEVSILEAVYHVVEHFSMHTGQIIFATKMLTGGDLGFYRHLSARSHGQQTP